MSLAVAYRMKCRGKKMAHGGMVEEEKASGYEAEPEEHPVENEAAEMEDEDMISRIMRQRYSKGGMVANKTPVTADFEDNEFDDLVLDDHLEEHYTGANSGDELGDAEHDREEHKDRDMVSRIMRRRYQHNPRPA